MNHVVVLAVDVAYDHARLLYLYKIRLSIYTLRVNTSGGLRYHLRKTAVTSFKRCMRHSFVTVPSIRRCLRNSATSGIFLLPKSDIKLSQSVARTNLSKESVFLEGEPWRLGNRFNLPIVQGVEDLVDRARIYHIIKSKLLSIL